MTVPHKGRGWVLAPCLIDAEAEADRIAPNRSRASDGSIGDSAHAARVSDHNPSGGLVLALDLTHDPPRGFDAHAHARNIAARRDPRVKYLISNRQIWTPERGWYRYTGTSPHTAHAHMSILRARANDRGPWFNATIPFPTPATPPVFDPKKDRMSDTVVRQLNVSSGPPEVWVFWADGERQIVRSPEELAVFTALYGPVEVTSDKRTADVIKNGHRERRL